MSALAEALEAVTCAMSEEADDGDADAVKALQGIADAIQQQLTTEASEPDADPDMDPDSAMAYAKGRRVLAKRALRRLPRLAKKAGSLRKTNVELRKERRELRKAAILTSVLTKSGSRNSTSDLAKIDAIHAATVDLGTTTHRVAAPDVATPDTGSAEAPIAKSAIDPVTIMREALAGIVPIEKLDAIEARLAAQAETAKAQGEMLAKIAKSPTNGGPATAYAPIFRGGSGVGEITDKASALAKAAEMIDDPRLKEQVGDAAAFEMIRRQRGAS